MAIFIESEIFNFETDGASYISPYSPHPNNRVWGVGVWGFGLGCWGNSYGGGKPFSNYPGFEGMG